MGIPQSGIHHVFGAQSFRMGCGDMMGICRCAAAGDFAVYFCAPCHCMLQFFQNHYTGTFPHNKTIPVFIVGPAGRFGVSFLSLNAFMALNPPTPASLITLSEPPVKIISAMPNRIRLKDSMMALVEDAQALTTAKLGPENHAAWKLARLQYPVSS